MKRGNYKKSILGILIGVILIVGIFGVMFVKAITQEEQVEINNLARNPDQLFRSMSSPDVKTLDFNTKYIPALISLSVNDAQSHIKTAGEDFYKNIFIKANSDKAVSLLSRFDSDSLHRYIEVISGGGYGNLPLDTGTYKGVNGHIEYLFKNIKPTLENGEINPDYDSLRQHLVKLLYAEEKSDDTNGLKDFLEGLNEGNLQAIHSSLKDWKYNSNSALFPDKSEEEVTKKVKEYRAAVLGQFVQKVTGRTDLKVGSGMGGENVKIRKVGDGDSSKYYIDIVDSDGRAIKSLDLQTINADIKSLDVVSREILPRDGMGGTTNGENSKTEFGIRYGIEMVRGNQRYIDDYTSKGFFDKEKLFNDDNGNKYNLMSMDDSQTTRADKIDKITISNGEDKETLFDVTTSGFGKDNEQGLFIRIFPKGDVSKSSFVRTTTETSSFKVNEGVIHNNPVKQKDGLQSSIDVFTSVPIEGHSGEYENRQKTTLSGYTSFQYVGGKSDATKDLAGKYKEPNRVYFFDQSNINDNVNQYYISKIEKGNSIKITDLDYQVDRKGGSNGYSAYFNVANQDKAGGSIQVEVVGQIVSEYTGNDWKIPRTGVTGSTNSPTIGGQRVTQDATVTAGTSITMESIQKNTVQKNGYLYYTINGEDKPLYVTPGKNGYAQKPEDYLIFDGNNYMPLISYLQTQSGSTSSIRTPVSSGDTPVQSPTTSTSTGAGTTATSTSSTNPQTPSQTTCADGSCGTQLDVCGSGGCGGSSAGRQRYIFNGPIANWIRSRRSNY